MIKTSLFSLGAAANSAALFTYTLSATGTAQAITALSVEIDGQLVHLQPGELKPAGVPAHLRNGIQESRFEGDVAGQDGLRLSLIVRTVENSPFLRFRYELSSDRPRRLTKSTGKDELEYLSTSFAEFDAVREVRFSEFNELYHSFCLVETEVDERQFSNGVALMGPILAASGSKDSLLLAYEHGSQLPDRFLEFVPDVQRQISLRATKGNYYEGQHIGQGKTFQSIWFQLGAVPGDIDSLAATYRDFVLNGQSPSTESRKPYIFYNTWNYQERNQDWNKKTYLESMTAERMEAEIDVAHRMGIDVFVLDTGWYEKTGDWRVSRKRFPEGLAPIKKKLDGYGMKLGLWMYPIVAAISSDARARSMDSLISWKGKVQEPYPIWETEASAGMCLVGPFADALVDTMRRMHDEDGVTYFKWDAIGQYGCSDPNHDHGTAENSEAERADSYAFLLGNAMADIVDRLVEHCPDAIVDFDITEGARSVGLSFLSAGKYFLINNGPYYHNYDIPAPAERNVNMFFFAGPARGWICRAPLNYDRWIPSVLFLTHYFPDDPEENQWISLASLMLGQNGIWGDLLSVSEEGVARLGAVLALYKQIRDDITVASPVRSGPIGGSPEVHEKISSNGKGIVSLFASAPGTYTYVTEHKVDSQIWHTEGASVKIDSQGRAVVEATFTKPSAQIVLFGVTSPQN